MARLSYSMMTSLDGFIATPSGGLDWVTIDEELHAWSNEQERATVAAIYGRGMYETMAGYWPHAADDPDEPPVVHEYARIWAETPRVVFSRTLHEVAWNSRLATDDLGTEIRRLKEELDGTISIGGARVAAEAIRLGLVDELWPIVNPVVLGEGRPFLPPDAPRQQLRLVETRTFGSGVVALRYEVARA
jgi:dihydrofolate reductase